MSQSGYMDSMDGDGRGARMTAVIILVSFLFGVVLYSAFLVGKAHGARTTIIHVPDCSGSSRA